MYYLPTVLFIATGPATAAHKGRFFPQESRAGKYKGTAGEDSA
jgi:hypothetical protein